MKSKDLKILVDRLEKEIARNRNSIADMYKGDKPFDEKMYQIHQDYINYHEEIIRFIKKVDKELAE